MPWIILFFAGLFEVGWAVGLKYTDGFSRPLPTALTVGAMIFAAPLGIVAAIYFSEYAKNGRAVNFLRMCVGTLAGVPSIVFGLFGLARRPFQPQQLFSFVLIVAGIVVMLSV